MEDDSSITVKSKLSLVSEILVKNKPVIIHLFKEKNEIDQRGHVGIFRGYLDLGGPVLVHGNDRLALKGHLAEP